MTLPPPDWCLWKASRYTVVPPVAGIHISATDTSLTCVKVNQRHRCQGVVVVVVAAASGLLAGAARVKAVTLVLPRAPRSEARTLLQECWQAPQTHVHKTRE